MRIPSGTPRSTPFSTSFLSSCCLMSIRHTEKEKENKKENIVWDNNKNFTEMLHFTLCFYDYCISPYIYKSC
ncbi:hypothetical protein TIFTF001_019344 [Ficus carica]|uniref:Uncharacterized protein n=1 Tax=Ficus carica TaxID=3494 RepID=A0AA88AWW0_FICCA|nr:hypothetical protein TIFTF001_019344 [Ficus carica]